MQKKPIGSWPEYSKADDVEEYLLMTQKKFRKYKLNIFDLNHVSGIRLSHGNVVRTCLATLVFPEKTSQSHQSEKRVQRSNEK